MIFALEGPCYAGKTTLSRELAKVHSDFHRISEYCEVSKKFPGLARNEHERKRNSIFFQELEANRQEEVISLLSEKKKVILDRCFLSIIAFDYSINYKILIDWKRTKNEFNHFTFPDLIIFLDLSHQEILRRKSKDTFKIPSHFVEEEYNKRYRIFFERVYTGTSTEFVDVEDSEKNNMAKISHIIKYFK